jgi:hypothetical protein
VIEFYFFKCHTEKIAGMIEETIVGMIEEIGIETGTETITVETTGSETIVETPVELIHTETNGIDLVIDTGIQDQSNAPQSIGIQLLEILPHPIT